MNTKKKSWFYKKIKPFIISITVVYSIFFITFFLGISQGMNQTVPEAIDRHTYGISVAISHLRYGRNDHVGYNKVFKTLVDNGFTNDPNRLASLGKQYDENLKDPQLLNEAITKALDIENVESEGIHPISYTGDDIGLTDYYQLAFRVFGYKIQGFYYLYFLLLFISITAFFIQFKDNKSALTTLILFLIAHWVIVGTATHVGIQIQTVHNPRFMTVLSILPILHLSLFQLNCLKINPVSFCGLLVQFLIFMLIRYVRSTSLWGLLFFGLIIVFEILKYVLKKEFNLSDILKKNKLIIGVVCGYSIISLILVLSLNPKYKTEEWDYQRIYAHNIYLGFVYHPELRKKYQLTGADSDSYEAAFKKLRSQGKEKESIFYNGRINDKVYAKIISEVVKDVIATYPRQSFETFFYEKPFGFQALYFQPGYGVKQNLFSPLSLAGLSYCIYLLRNHLKKTFKMLLLSLFMLIFSFLPLFLAYPANHTMTDSSLVLTLVIYYLVIVGILGSIWGSKLVISLVKKNL